MNFFAKKDGEIHYNTARLYLNLAIILAKKGETAKADEYYQTGEKCFSQFPDKNLSNFFVGAQARYEIAKGNLSNAEKLLETSIAENTYDRDSQLSKGLLVILRLLYLQDKNYQKLADLSKEEFERAKQDIPRDEFKIGLINLEIATALYRSGKNEEAIKYFDEGFPVYKTLPADSLSRLNFNENISECLFNQKRYAEAKPILENVVAFHLENYPPNHEDIPKFKEMLDKTKANLKE
ncbi:MAG: tetratricopeptide repeat protein [Blastocatellia bacterium]|nr:tetratricopeptide repeat protein [Blastocatellia bacterium]